VSFLSSSSVVPSFAADNHGTLLLTGSRQDLAQLGGTQAFGGWGGIRLFESVVFDQKGASSVIFQGETASQAELTMLELKRQGFNAIRVMFESPISTQANRRVWGWDNLWFDKTLQIAKALDMWLIVDWHGYTDSYQFTDQWIGFWRDSVVSKYKDSYEKIVWEPINEPLMRWNDGSHELGGKEAVNALTSQYQKWVDMARGLGDTHWIVVSALCYWSSLPVVEWFPVLTDPLNRLFLGMHFYYFYAQHQGGWTVADAQAQADYVYNDIIVSAITRYNRPFLVTEMGAHYGTTAPPDIQFDGSAGYSTVSLAFAQRMIANFDAHPGRIGYLLWTAGDWTTAGLYGGLGVWGASLHYDAFYQAQLIVTRRS